MFIGWKKKWILKVIQKYSIKVTKLMMKQDLVSIENKRVYEYYFELMISAFVNLVILLVLIIFSERYFEGLSFLVTFLLLRRYSGGFHASSHLACILGFTGIFIVFLFVILFLPDVWFNIVSIMAITISIPIIIIKAPMTHPNKPLSKTKILNFRKKVRLRVIMIGFVITIGSFFYQKNSVLLSVALSTLVVALLLLPFKSNSTN